MIRKTEKTSGRAFLSNYCRETPLSHQGTIFGVEVGKVIKVTDNQDMSRKRYLHVGEVPLLQDAQDRLVVQPVVDQDLLLGVQCQDATGPGAL